MPSASRHGTTAAAGRDTPTDPSPQSRPHDMSACHEKRHRVLRVRVRRLGRPMTQPETAALDAALVEALGVLRVGTDADHRAALQLVALTALSTPAGAHLWACLLDEAEHTFHSVAAYAAAVVSAAGAVASAQLAAALGLVCEARATLPPMSPPSNRNSGKPKSKKQFVLTCSRFLGRVSCSGSPVIGVPRRQSGRLQKASPKPLYLMYTLRGPFLQRGPRAIGVPHRQSERLQKASPKPLFLMYTLQGPFLQRGPRATGVPHHQSALSAESVPQTPIYI